MHGVQAHFRHEESGDYSDAYFEPFDIIVSGRMVITAKHISSDSASFHLSRHYDCIQQATHGFACVLNIPGKRVHGQLASDFPVFSQSFFSGVDD